MGKFVFEAGSPSVAQTGFEFTVVLRLPPRAVIIGICHCAWQKQFPVLIPSVL